MEQFFLGLSGLLAVSGIVVRIPTKYDETEGIGRIGIAVLIMLFAIYLKL